jgi:hypothetical protein
LALASPSSNSDPLPYPGHASQTGEVQLWASGKQLLARIHLASLCAGGGGGGGGPRVLRCCLSACLGQLVVLFAQPTEQVRAVFLELTVHTVCRPKPCAVHISSLTSVPEWFDPDPSVEKTLGPGDSIRAHGYRIGTFVIMNNNSIIVIVIVIILRSLLV